MTKGSPPRPVRPFSALRPGAVFRFTTEAGDGHGVGPWLKTGARSYRGLETGVSQARGPIHIITTVNLLTVQDGV